MDLDRSNSVELEKRDHIHSSQTILKTPEKPPSPIYNYRQNHVTTVLLAGVPIVCLFIDGKERLCLAQISNTLLKTFSYNEIHNRRVALGITCVQCTPVQLEILRRAGAMPISSRRCGMITKREAERLVKSFLEDNSPPKLPDNFYFEVEHNCGWGCRGRFEPSRYNSSRAKCIKCTLCSLFFSPNKFIFHFHRTPESKYNHPDAANFNSWRRHLGLVPGTDTEDIIHAWEDVKAMFNGGSRKRVLSSSGSGFSSPSTSNSEPKKPKLHLDDAGISKPSFQGQYPNYPMFTVPGKAYPFAPLAAHNQLGITFPFGKESSHHEVAKQCHGFNHSPWRSSSNFIFPTYDLLWANHFNMGNMNSPVTNFRPNMYQSHNVKDLSLFSVDRHSPSDSANSTEDDDSQMSPIGSNINSNFPQNNQRLSAFKPVHKIDNTRSDKQSVNLEQTDENEEETEPVENSDVDIDGEIGDVKDKSRSVHLNKNTVDKDSELKVADIIQHSEGPKADTNQHIDTPEPETCHNTDLDKQQGTQVEQIEESPEKLCYMQKYDNNNEATKNKNTEVNKTCQDICSSLELHTSSTEETTTESDQVPGKADADTREQVEQTINRIQGSLKEQPAMEKCEKEEIAQQLQILKDALCNELEQERQIRYSMQQKLKEAHDALHNFSCKILSSRQCTDCTFKDTASTIPR